MYPSRAWKREDAVLGAALLLSVPCGVLSFYLSFTTALNYALLSGIIRLSSQLTLRGGLAM